MNPEQAEFLTYNKRIYLIPHTAIHLKNYVGGPLSDAAIAGNEALYVRDIEDSLYVDTIKWVNCARDACSDTYVHVSILIVQLPTEVSCARRRKGSR